MNDNTLVERSDDQSTDFLSRGDNKREKHHDDPLPWLGGAVLVIVGIALLLRNFTGFSLNNWWALFILIPVVGSFGAAWRDYQNHGWTAAVRGSLVGGTILLFVMSMFLFSLSWGALWPVFLIIAGVGALLSAVLR